MQLQNLIYNNVKPLSLSNKIETVVNLIKPQAYSHYPVVDNGEFLGLVAEQDLYNFDNSKKLEEYTYAFEVVYVLKDTHWLDVLEKCIQNETNIMPVLDIDNTYLGCYELADILNLFSETPFLSEPGGELVVEKGILDYSLSEISQIVESNNAKLLGAFISDMNEDFVQITLKVSGEGLNTIIQTFRRYGYNIVLGNEDDMFLKDLKERSDYLKKYLNI